VSKKLKTLVITFLIIGLFSLEFPQYAKAEPQDLSMFPIPPLSAPVGDSFIFEVRISNQNTTISHNYKVLWWVDDLSWFISQGVIEPNETISLTPSFTFSTPGDHKISIELFEDEISIDKREFFVTIEEIRINISLAYKFDNNPIYPNSSFSLTFEVINEGSETIYDTVVRVSNIEQESRIRLQGAAVSHLNNITAGNSNNTTLPYSASYDTIPGVYSLRVRVEFSDAQGFPYKMSYYIPIPISSGYVRDKLDVLEPKFKILEGKLENLENTMLLYLTYIAIAVIAVNAVTAALNYWYAKRSARRARARLKALKK